MLQHSASLLCACVLLVAAGCDSGNPVVPAPPQVSPVPSGVALSVTLTISPTQLVAGSGVPGTVSIETKLSDGQPPANGTLVTVSTNLGSLGSEGNTTETIGMSDGIARVSLFPAAEVGTATVLAQVGDQIGELQVAFVEDSQAPMFITSVQPGSGSPSGGTQVTISGGGFDSPIQVDFGGGAASVVSASATQITVQTPPSATPVPTGTSLTVDVTVTGALDTNAPLVAVLPGGFIYSASGGGSGIFVSEVVPNVGSAGGGETVRILGSGFQSPASISFGGVAGSAPTVINSTEITVVVPPPGQPVPAGGTLPVDVVVTSGLDQTVPQTATLAGGYVYSDTGGSVFITSIEPSSGGPDGGESVSVFGGGFVAPAQVTFGGISGITPAVISDSEIQVVVPAPAAPVADGASLAVDVVVTSGLDQTTPGTATRASGYTYVGGTAIEVLSISPTEGPAAGGTTVTLNGRGLPSSAAVDLAGVRQFNVNVASETSLTFDTAALVLDACPPGGRSAQVGVDVTDTSSGAVGTNSALMFTYIVPLPRIDRIAPTFGPQLGNTVVSIEGAGFSDPIRVDFVTATASFAAPVQSSTSTLVRVSSPRLPDSAFPEADCTTDDNAVGKRYLQTTVGVTVRDPESGCTDTFANAFTYDPTDSSCRQTQQGGN